jgi:hypothetical protein
MILQLFFVFLPVIQIVFSLGSAEFKLNEVDSTVSDIIWCGHSREVIFVLTDLNSVYKSENRGFSWTKLNDIFHQKATSELEPNENEVFFFLI